MGQAAGGEAGDLTGGDLQEGGDLLGGEEGIFRAVTGLRRGGLGQERESGGPAVLGDEQGGAGGHGAVKATLAEEGAPRAHRVVVGRPE